MVDLGLKDVGYEYVVIDAGWQASERDESGRQQPNATKFPNGIGPVANTVHSLGLKLGIYSDAGILTCSFEPGSWGYEERDARTYAEWGIDYLKVSCRLDLEFSPRTRAKYISQYDNCGSFQAATYSPYERFSIMGNALLHSGRDIFYSLCQWGNQFPWLWADQVGQSYRMSGDIHNSFAKDGANVCTTAYCLNTGYAGCSVLTIIRKMREVSSFQAPGSWADMDMLEVGNHAMTEAEERTHFSFWSALKSPLIIGADLSNISQSSLNVLKNKEIIAINQDPLGAAVTYVSALSVENQIQVWVGPLTDGRVVVLVLNEGTATANVSLSSSALTSYASSCSRNQTQGYYFTNRTAVRDIWNKVEIPWGTTIHLPNITSHDTRVLIVGGK